MMTARWKDAGLAWRRRGLCAGLPSHYDAAVDTKRGRATQVSEQFIQTLCTGCPVRGECLSFGVQTRSTGIFGGERLEFGRTLTARRVSRRGARARGRSTAGATTDALRPRHSVRTDAPLRPAGEVPSDGRPAQAHVVSRLRQREAGQLEERAPTRPAPHLNHPAGCSTTFGGPSIHPPPAGGTP
jgi:hypothetical protein